MSLGFLLLILLVGGVVVMGGFVVASYLSSGSRVDQKELRATRTREKIATKALRAIANGAGNPILEAQDALDNMESTYTKELN